MLSNDDTPLRKFKLLILESTITCPRCSHAAVETMPRDACQFFYDCRNCGLRLKPKAGDCCVFCSYGSGRCPPMQTGECGCTGSQNGR